MPSDDTTPVPLIVRLESSQPPWATVTAAPRAADGPPDPVGTLHNRNGHGPVTLVRPDAVVLDVFPDPLVGVVLWGVGGQHEQL